MAFELPALTRYLGDVPQHEHFVDSGGPDGVAIAVEADPKGALYPAVYVRRDNRLTETLLASDPMLDFETAEHRVVLTAALDGMFD